MTLARALRRPFSVTRLFDEDPELFDGVARAEVEHAAARIPVKAYEILPGRWTGRLPGGEPERGLGVLVVGGVLLRTVEASGRRASELLGPGDLVRPWECEGGGASIPFAVRWDALERCRFAALEESTLRTACRWPAVVGALTGRAARRADWLALQLTISDLRRVDDRLLSLFWHCADRWGSVAPAGIDVPLRVTHDVLAQLVCAQRPTVTAALRRLQRQGFVRRRADRTWLLLRDPPDSLGLAAGPPADAIGIAS